MPVGSSNRGNGVSGARLLARVGAAAGAAAVAGLLAWSGPAAAGETRGYVMNWFYPTGHFGDGDCPSGPNPLSEVFYRRLLKEMGYNPKQIDDVLEGFPNEGLYKEIVIVRGRNHENVYYQPWTVPDPGMKTVEGKFASGFNLNGVVEPNGFTDPETGEQGVDNQLYRAVGCLQAHRAPPPERPAYYQTRWDILRDQMPAYLVEITGLDDPVNDDEVEVGIYRALTPVQRDSTGETRADTTFQVDPDPRSHNRLKGRLKDGVITTEVIPALHLVGDPYMLTAIDIKQARLRLKLKPDGTLEGVLGGYHDWWPIYWGYGSNGWALEHSIGIEIPAMYYALRRLADGPPDPQTGVRKSISLAYGIEAKPAFVVHLPPKKAPGTAAAPSAAPARRLAGN
jgi:hypothetical protein